MRQNYTHAHVLMCTCTHVCIPTHYDSPSEIQLTVALVL